MRRRSVLGMTAMAGLGGLAPVARGAQAVPPSPEMQILSEYMAAAAGMLLPSDAAEQGRRRLAQAPRRRHQELSVSGVADTWWILRSAPACSSSGSMRSPTAARIAA